MLQNDASLCTKSLITSEPQGLCGVNVKIETYHILVFLLKPVEGILDEPGLTQPAGRNERYVPTVLEVRDELASLLQTVTEVIRALITLIDKRVVQFTMLMIHSHCNNYVTIIVLQDLCNAKIIILFF